MRPLPCTSQARPTRGDTFHHCFSKPDCPSGESLVARIEEPGRRVHELRALDAAAEVLEAEVGDRAVRDLLTEERLPAEARIERHAFGRAPGVLRVPALVPAG